MNKYLTQPNPTAHLYSGGKTDHETMISRGLAQVAEIVAHVDQPELAEQARRTLNDICWSPSTGYPPPVRAALERAGLRTEA